MTASNHTLAFALNSWAASNCKNGVLAQKLARTVLKLYVLESLGFDTRGMKRRDFKAFCEKLLLSRLAKELVKYRKKQQDQLFAPVGKTLTPLPLPEGRLVDLMSLIFDCQFDAAVAVGTTSQETKRNYSATLNQLLKWLDEQCFWQVLDPSQFPEIVPPSVKPDKRPRFRQKFSNYALRENELPERLQEEINGLGDFWTTAGKAAGLELRKTQRAGGERNVRRPNVQKKSKSAFDNYTKKIIRQYMGWCVHEGKAIEELSLQLLTDPMLVEDYTFWLVEERQCTHKTGMHLVEISIAVLKWLNFDKVKRQNWTDIELITDFRDLQSEFKQKYKQEQSKSNKQKWKTKNLNHEQLQQISLHLKKNLAPFRGVLHKGSGKRVKGARRSLSAILWSCQRHLLVKLLTYLPVRKHEILQFEIGVTLCREVDKQGKPTYIARGIHHKQEYRTGETRDYALPSILAPDLDAWIQIQRPQIQQATQTLEGWLALTGHKIEDLEKLRQRLEIARQDKSENKAQYIRNLELCLQRLQRRVDAWQSAKANVEDNKYLFFMFSHHNPENFGKPPSLSSIYKMVLNATSKTSKQLFGQSYYVNPHAFRHIAAQRVRQIKGDAEALSETMNHTQEMGDIYAAQIEDGTAGNKNIDDWWEPKLE